MSDEIIHLLNGQYLYVSDCNQLINAAVKDRFLMHRARRKLTIRDVDVDEEAIKKKTKGLGQLILDVTENCNLRCKYCVYNDNYINQRELTPHDMDFETAKKGLDYVFSLVKDRKKKQFILGFYGGEPLLNLKTIKKITAYGKKLFSGWDLLLNMTTNLTLLNDPILDFLAANDFALLVSLDGGKENHDAKRVFSDGKGSHDIVMANLEKIALQHNGKNCLAA